MSWAFETSVDAAQWLKQRAEQDSTARASRTLLLGPDGFDAYLRVLALPDPTSVGQTEAEIADDVIESFPADVELVGKCIEALTGHTGTPDDLYFLLWDGWPYSPSLPSTVRITIGPSRRFALARGTYPGWRSRTDADAQGGYPPGFVWPVDRSWCVAYDVDSHFAGVGGTQDAIDAVQSHACQAVPWVTTDGVPTLYA